MFGFFLRCLSRRLLTLLAMVRSRSPIRLAAWHCKSFQLNLFLHHCDDFACEICNESGWLMVPLEESPNDLRQRQRQREGQWGWR